MILKCFHVILMESNSVVLGDLLEFRTLQSFIDVDWSLRFFDTLVRVFVYGVLKDF